MRIAISTGGGDAPGLNAVIRAATLSALSRGWSVLGIKRGYYGLLGEDEVVPLTADAVRGIVHQGGRSSGPRIAGIPSTSLCSVRMGAGTASIAPTR